MDALVEVLAQIRHSKDENGSRYAVKRLAELVRDEEGFVAKLAARSPEQGELFHLWDLGLVKNASPQYVENLCFVLESLMKHPGTTGETKVSCGLILMSCIADHGARFVTRILKQFDFSLNALKVVGVPPKVSGGKMMNAADDEGDGLYARRLWDSDDLSKRPTRVAFVQFFKSMVSNCDELRLPLLLSMKYFASNAMHYISRDPYDAQLMVLSLVKTCVLEQPCDVLTPPTKAAVLSDKFIGQLVAIMQRSGDDTGADEVAHEASLLLTKILTDTRLGVTDGKTSLHECLFYDTLSTAKSSKRRVLKILLGMKPGPSHRIFLLLQHVFESDPLVAMLYLSEMPLDIEPRETSSFAANSAITIIALDNVIRGLKQIGSVDLFERQVLLANWKAVMSSKISKASLSKGIQHAAPFVAHSSALMLERILQSLNSVLGFLERADEVERIDSVADKLRQIARKHVPDVQLVVAYHSKVCDNQHDNTQRSIRRSGSLRLLREWIRAFPESLAESNVQIDKLVPDNIGVLHSQNQKEYMQLMNIACQYSKTSILSPKFESILKLLSEHRVRQGDPEEVSSLCHEWLVDQLCSTRIFCQGTSGTLVWLDNLPADSVFVLDFFVDALKATIRRPTHYFEILSKACDEPGILTDIDLDASEVTPLFACAVQRACRILKSKRDAGDKSLVLSFLKHVILSSLLISVNPYSYIAVLMHVLGEEITQEMSNGNKKRKHATAEEYLPESMLQLCKELEHDSYEWILNIIKDFQVLSIERDRKKSKSGFHKSCQADEGGWASYDPPLSRTLSYISPTHVRGFLNSRFYSIYSQDDSSDQSVESLVSADVYQFMTCFQHFLLFGAPEEVASTTIDVVDTLKSYVSKSEDNASKAVEAFFGTSTRSFWECLGSRLDRADISVTHSVGQIIQCFASLESDSKNKMYASVLSCYENSRLEDISRTRMWENRDVVLCLLIEQCRSSINLLRLDIIASWIIDIIEQMFRSPKSVFFYAMFDAISRVFLKKIQISERISMQIISDVALALSAQLEKHGKHDISNRHVSILVMFGSLNVLMDSQETSGQAVSELAGLTTFLMDGLFMHLDDSRCVTTLVALAKFVDPRLLLRNLTEHLEKAKDEKTKYKRRLGLARLVPILDKCLSINSSVLSQEDLDEVRNAYLHVLMQYVFSRKEVDVETVSDEERVAFTRLETFLTPTIKKLLHLGQWDVQVSKQITEFIEMNPKKVFGANESLGNPKLRSKIEVLQIFVLALGRASKSSLGDIDLPEFTCQASIWAMRAITFCMKNNFQVLEPLLQLLNCLGDLLAGFNNDERLTRYFKPLIHTLTKECLPKLITVFPQEIDIWRELRRFTAALVPQEDDSESLSNGTFPLENDMYRDLASAFLYMISHNNLLKCLQDATSRGSDISQEYLWNHLPLGTLTGCVSLSISDARGNGQVRLPSTTDTVKNEICEIIESVLDLLSHFESQISPELQSEYIESFRTGEFALLQYLLASYGASLSATDMAVWSLIKCLNERAWKRKRASHDDFNNGHVAFSMEAIMQGPIAKLQFLWGNAVLSSSSRGLKINPIRCAILSANFPEWRRLFDSDRLPDDALASDIAPEYRMSYEKSAYDPSFLLPLCLFSLRNDAIECADIIDSLLLPVLLRSLGSADAHMRGIALECLYLLEGKSVSPSSTDPIHHEFDRVKLVLGWIKNSIQAPFQRIPAMHAFYAAETSVALFSPTGLLYSNITKALTKAPQLDWSSIPQMLKFMLRNSSHLAERQWLERMLICGLRTANDVFLYRKSHIFEIAMYVASASHENRCSKRLSLLLLERACHIPKAARVMAESCGLPSWLVKKVIDDSETCIESRSDSALDSLRMSVNAWKAMCSWKSVTRGSRRDQYHIQEDLLLSANRIRLMLQLRHATLFNSQRGRMIHEMLENMATQ
ncbi:hypothetical protein M9435_001547 [Picochlorum sp. BPE23]|nr:hypothetical protein M9435_001547 [Picochlorum sp. BPE23]